MEDSKIIENSQAIDPRSDVPGWTGVVILMAAIVLLTYMITDYLSFAIATPGQKLEQLWADDILKLESSGKLPHQWPSFKKVTVLSGTPTAQNWIQDLKIPIEGQPQGEYDLEILILSFQEDQALGAVIQYTITDPKNGNMVFEFGRTLMIEGEISQLGLISPEPIDTQDEGPNPQENP